MDNFITEIDKMRKEMLRSFILSFIPFFAGMLTAITIHIVSYYYQLEIKEYIGYAVAVFIIGMAISIYLSIFWATSKYKIYVSKYKNEIVKSSLESVFANVVFEPEKCFDKEFIAQTFMIPIGNVFKGDDKVTAEYKGVQFTRCDLTVQNVTSTGKSTSVVTYFMGQWIVLDFHKKIETNLQIREREFNSAAKGFGLFSRAPKMEYVKTESIDFNKKFAVFAEDPHSAFYIITPHFMEVLFKLQAAIDGQFILGFVGGLLHIAIHTNQNVFQPPIISAVSPTEKDKMLAQTYIITQLIDELNINLIRQEK